jgi:hypothetical protein
VEAASAAGALEAAGRARAEVGAAAVEEAVATAAVAAVMEAGARLFDF